MILLKYLIDQGEGITVAGFRDLIDANRKFCLNLFTLFDAEGFTFRDGNYRKITNSGIKFIERYDNSNLSRL